MYALKKILKCWLCSPAIDNGCMTETMTKLYKIIMKDYPSLQYLDKLIISTGYG